MDGKETGGRGLGGRDGGRWEEAELGGEGLEMKGHTGHLWLPGIHSIKAYRELRPEPTNKKNHLVG